MPSWFKRLGWNNLRQVWKQPAKAQRPVVLVLEEFERRLTPSVNYYVSPSGNDAADGSSPARAWRTINRVNEQTYFPGDSINFQGGATYNGSLYFGAPDGGAPDNPVTVTSYNGRATISSGTQEGLGLINVSGFNISNLAFVGSSSGRDNVDGIHDYDSRSVAHIYLDNVDVSGYGGQGITFIADTSVSIQGIHVTHTAVHDDGGPGYRTTAIGGITIWGTDFSHPISDVYVGDVQVFNNDNQFGIYVANISGGTVERMIVHDIGGPLTQNTLGIAVWVSDHVTVQRNESYNITDPIQQDGDGFIFGNGVSDSVMQYNYAHDNSGYGLELVADLPGQPSNTGNTIRYNITENDGWAGIVVAGDVWNAEIYNNTVYVTGGVYGPGGLDMDLLNWTGTGLHIRNNIFQSAPSSLNFWTNLYSTVTGRDLELQGNAYYEDDGSFGVGYVERSFSNLSSWQNATGEEFLDDGTPVGYAGDPQLVAPGQGGTIGDPDLLAILYAYTLQPSSPLNSAGLDLAGLFGIDPGGQDFYGNPLAPGSSFSVGAYQPPLGPAPKVTALFRGFEPAAAPVVLGIQSVNFFQLDFNAVSWRGEDFQQPEAPQSPAPLGHSLEHQVRAIGVMERANGIDRLFALGVESL